MKKIKFLLVLAFSSQMALAQLVDVKEKVSGYLGKRWIIGMNGFFSLSTQPQKWDSEKFITLNKSFHISTQYTLTNRVSLGLAFGLCQSSVDVDINSMDYYYIQFPETRFPYEYKQLIGRPMLSDRTINFEIRNFRKYKGAVSPFGSYFSVGLNLHNINVDLSEIQFQTYTNDRLSEEISIEDPIISKNAPELYIGFGVAKPIWNSIFLDFGLKSGLMLGSSLIDTIIDTSGEEITLKDMLVNESIQRIGRKELINFKLGLQFPIK